MTEDERLAIWLDALLNSELDLRPSRGVVRETRFGPKTPRIIILESGEFAGYANCVVLEVQLNSQLSWLNLNLGARDLPTKSCIRRGNVGDKILSYMVPH